MGGVRLKGLDDRLDSGALLVGLLMGLLAGGLIALFRAPRKGSVTRRQIVGAGHDLRQHLEEAVTPLDPIAESMAEGKAAAQRRRAELGLDK